MTVKMCIKYPQQLRDDGIGLIKRREMWNRRHAAVAKPLSPPKPTLVRRVGVVTQKHPYLNNPNSEVAARIKTVVAELSSAKEKSPEVGLVTKAEPEPAGTPIKPEPGSGVDAFIAVMVHASKCKYVQISHYFLSLSIP